MSDEATFKAIAELDNARSKATVAGDIDTAESFLAATMVYVHGSGTAEDRELYVTRLREGFYDYKAQEALHRDFRKFGDVVLVHGDQHIHVIVNGNEKDFVTRYLQIWVQESGEWKMAAWQSTPLPAA